MIALAACSVIVHAQRPTPRASAPFDLTGQWVSLITEDWRHRQFTPPKGDYAALPLSPPGGRCRQLGPGTRRSSRRAMQGVRRGRSSAVADPAPRRLAGRHDAETGDRRRDANACVSVSDPLRACGGDWQGLSIASWDYPRAAFPGRGGGSAPGGSSRSSPPG